MEVKWQPWWEWKSRDLRPLLRAISQGRLKVCPARPWGSISAWFARGGACPFAMPETASPAIEFSADAYLISLLKAIPDGRYRRGVRYPQWYLLLVTLLGILSDCRSSRDLEAFAKRHREALNQALGLNFKCWPTDAPLQQGSPGAVR